MLFGTTPWSGFEEQPWFGAPFSLVPALKCGDFIQPFDPRATFSGNIQRRKMI